MICADAVSGCPAVLPGSSAVSWPADWDGWRLRVLAALSATLLQSLQ